MTMEGLAHEDEDATACTLFAGDLSSTCTEEHLYELFIPFGQIQQIRIQKSKKNVSLGYAFVTMDTPINAFNAMVSCQSSRAIYCRIHYSLFRACSCPAV
jgi:RNA recognition motif-containing protein